MLDELVAKLRLVAAGGLIVEPRGATFLEVAGRRRVGAPEPVTRDDPWHLGSNTKAMTATVAATLIEDGVLGWETTPHDVLPDLAGGFHAAFEGVTLRHLLTHTAGLEPDLLKLEEVWSRLWADGDRDVVATRRWFVERLLAREPVVAPGEQARYANASYIVAGAMLEAATGRPWERLIESRLFEPLGMRAGFGAPGLDGQPAPCGHVPAKARFLRRRKREAVEPGPRAANPPATAPAGGVHATLDGYARFLALHLRGAKGDTELLPHRAFERLHAPPPFLPDSIYASGWGRVSRKWADGVALTHAGSNTMWYATAWLAPEVDRGYVAVTNSGDGFRAINEIVAVLLRSSPED